MTTYGSFKWKVGEIYNTTGKGNLCSPGWLHAYETPLLAVLHNPIHGNFKDPKLFKADTLDGTINKDGQMKLGSTKMKLIEEIKLPKISKIQNIAYGILCAKAVYKDKQYNKWADKWLSGENRSKKSAAAAYNAAAYNADVAAYAAAYNAAAAVVDAADININLIKIAKIAITYK